MGGVMMNSLFSDYHNFYKMKVTTALWCEFKTTTFFAVYKMFNNFFVPVRSHDSSHQKEDFTSWGIDGAATCMHAYASALYIWNGEPIIIDPEPPTTMVLAVSSFLINK